MTRLLLAAIAVCAFTTVGCRHHNLASKGCSSCDTATIKQASCSDCGGSAGAGVQLAGHEHSGCSSCGGGVGGGAGITWGGHGYGVGGLRNPQAVPHLRHNEYPGATGPAGPSTATLGYPYYTTRGPRDFLIDDPPSIGY